MDPYKAAQEQYKKDRDIYMLALQDREMKMRVINSTFKSAIDKSTTDARSAMAIATTPDQKNAITSARRTAVASAIISRESAIEALEPLPLPPVQPQRPAKMSPQGMSEQKDKKKR
jgi:Na+-transporting NADH:ubiquinone oxidoreductase subunit NqrC